MASQATILWDGGQIEHAGILFKNLVALDLEIYGPKSPYTLGNIHSLTVCLYAQG